MLRILVTTDQWFPDFHGGSARVATDTAAHLAGQGHEVPVLAPQQSGQLVETTDGVLTVRRLLPLRSSTTSTLLQASRSWLPGYRAFRKPEPHVVRRPTRMAFVEAVRKEAAQPGERAAERMGVAASNAWEGRADRLLGLIRAELEG